MPSANAPFDTPEDDLENYPPRLRLTVMSPEEFREHTVAAAGAAESGESPDAIKAYENPGQLRELLSERRLEVMESIATDPPASISALAKRLDRNYSDVHSDVELLVEHGIVLLIEDGRAKRPVIPYDEITIDATLVTTVDRTDSSHPADA